MLQRMKNTLYVLLSRHKDYPQDELNRYALMLVISLIACGVHVFFTIFFFAIGVTSLGLSHSFGILVFLLSYVLLQRHQYDQAYLLTALMIVLSSVLTIYAVGGDNYSLLYQLLVLIMLLVVPFKYKMLDRVFWACMPLLMVGSYLFHLSHVPPHPIGTYNHVLSVLNILIVSVGVILMLSLERLVREFIERYNEERYQTLQHQAYQDPLTGLYNRRYAQAYFAKLREHPPAQSICIAIADLDDFKRINDTYGHDAGDAVLRNVSSILTSKVRKSDLVFRWGGEEFLLIIHDVTVENTAHILDTIRKTVQETPTLYGELSIEMSITIGIALLDIHDIEQRLVTCDKKLYEGKNNGKNQVVY